MIGFPNCKINLGLSVTGKRTDSFHDIETVMIPVNLSDSLEIISSDDKKTDLSISGLEVGGATEENLVMKAYRELKKDFDLPAVRMWLHKVVPAGAGLGGGSADAACALRLLNAIFGIGLSQTGLEHYAGKLGSDCPFFIAAKPVIASGRGDQFEPVKVALNNSYITIVKPAVEINTREAYSWIIPQQKALSLRQVAGLPLQEWKNYIMNDFEPVVFGKHPEVKAIKEKLYALGAVYASMTGSGSAVYGIFDEKINTSYDFPGCTVFENCRIAMGADKGIKQA
jgi:4-diphosphocytidyl-2-C-methyl-D-erythritol kinase